MNRGVLAVVLASTALVACGSCRGRGAPGDAGLPAEGGARSGPAVVPTASGDEGAPRAGMAFIPAGSLRAGTPREKTPRVADEEMAAVPIAMGAFYIDLLPYPDEAGAIPTSNVTRDEAEQLCAGRSKRLCTELEWERACKGPQNFTYEYGDAYHAATCGTGVTAEEAARRPSGERGQCKSGFGVADLHGIVWEWTSSSWGRGAKDPNLGVLRGGNAVAGELVGRCANAIGRPGGKKQPTMGFRCCAGPKNAPEVELEPKGTAGIEGLRETESLHATWDAAIAKSPEAGGTSIDRAYRWLPLPNDELVVMLGCTKTAPAMCAVSVGRDAGGQAAILGSVRVGPTIPELARIGDARHLRIRSTDAKGTFSREITYVYGRIEIADAKRP